MHAVYMQTSSEFSHIWKSEFGAQEDDGGTK